MTHRTPGTATTPAALDTIDATVDGLCACGCGTQLDPDGPSAWFASPGCQTRFYAARATDPLAVWLRPDAAPVYERRDSARVLLNEDTNRVRTLERAILDQITYRDPCSLAPMHCDQRARAWFRVRGSVHVPTASGGVAFADTDIRLCPRHEADILRAMDDDNQPLVSMAEAVRDPAAADLAERQGRWGEVWAGAMRQAQAAAAAGVGIITALPQSEPGADVEDMWENLLRAWRQLHPAPGPALLRCGQTARDAISTLPAADPPHDPIAFLLGVPVVVDDTLPPRAWRLVDGAGNVQREGTV